MSVSPASIRRIIRSARSLRACSGSRGRGTLCSAASLQAASTISASSDSPGSENTKCCDTDKPPLAPEHTPSKGVLGQSFVGSTDGTETDGVGLRTPGELTAPVYG